MGRLHQRHILVAISGGIAAYKGAELVRLLKKQGAAVRVVLSRGATEFITPLTMQALSGEPTHTELLDEEAEAGMGHIELAKWAELIVIAPASADCLARLAHGHADDLLSTLCLAATCPIALAPAMNQAMWANNVTQKNIDVLKQRGITIFGPAEGEQACGEIGPGRMLEPMELLEKCSSLFQKGLLAGKNLIITGGPTREAIDPVRYISNNSSGKMAFALAAEAADANAKVTLISGPVDLQTPSRVKRVNVESAEEMFTKVMEFRSEMDIFIGVAAVADYRPTQVAEEKIKKNDESLNLSLIKNYVFYLLYAFLKKTLKRLM